MPNVLPEKPFFNESRGARAVLELLKRSRAKHPLSGECDILANYVDDILV
jgi:hypothetical protein